MPRIKKFVHGLAEKGAVAEDRLIEMNIYDDVCDCQGQRTGRHLNCTVLRVKDKSWGQNSKVVIDADSKKGDSGMPYYWKNYSDEAYIVGIHNAGVDVDGDGNFDEAAGQAMFNAENNLQVTV